MDGNTLIPVAPGIAMMRFEYRDAMEKALELWEEHKKALPNPPNDEVYSFAYWLYRYSGLIKPISPENEVIGTERKNLKVYIAGKITGNPNYKAEFAAAERKLREQGYIVLNPAVLSDGFEDSEYHHINRAMIDVCDAVYFLPSWVDSKGAHMEMGYSLGTDKIIMYGD